MSDQHGEVRYLLEILTGKIKKCGDSHVSAPAICSSLYGLYHKSSDTVEVRRLLAALTAKVISCKEEFSPVQISRYSLY
jgi:hypothetical protein